MDDPTTELAGGDTIPANHHADHPGFSGLRGLIAAIAFLFGRDRATDLAVELAGLERGRRLVDVGCGPGVAARRARTLGVDVVAVDPAPVMLRVGSIRWPRAGISWRRGSAESIPVGDRSADVVWSLSTVHHWVDLDAGLAEVARVLAPGGRLVVTERRIDDPFATGVASHGWTVEQSETFAETCRRLGYVDVRTGLHDGAPAMVSVTADRR